MSRSLLYPVLEDEMREIAMQSTMIVKEQMQRRASNESGGSNRIGNANGYSV